MRRTSGEGTVGGGLRVLGIDPGTSVTGWAVVEAQGRRFVHLASGLIKPKGGSLPGKLALIYEALCRVVSDWRPTVACIEKSFVARNAQSALRLGEIRGVVALAAAQAGLGVREYSPAEIKVAVTGYGRADKGQMQYAVAKLLVLRGVIEADRADALAAALCCLQRAPAEALLARVKGYAGAVRQRVRAGRARR